MKITSFLNKFLFKKLNISRLENWELTNQWDWLNEAIGIKQVLYHVSQEGPFFPEQIIYFYSNALWKVTLKDNMEMSKQTYDNEKMFDLGRKVTMEGDRGVLTFLAHLFDFKVKFIKDRDQVNRRALCPINSVYRPTFIEEPVLVLQGWRFWILKHLLSYQMNKGKTVSKIKLPTWYYMTSAAKWCKEPKVDQSQTNQKQNAAHTVS